MRTWEREGELSPGCLFVFPHLFPHRLDSERPNDRVERKSRKDSRQERETMRGKEGGLVFDSEAQMFLSKKEKHFPFSFFEEDKEDKGKEKKKEFEEESFDDLSSFPQLQREREEGEEWEEEDGVEWENEYRFTEEEVDEEVREAMRNRSSVWGP